MKVYVPAATAPPGRRWTQKLSVAVTFGSGLAIAGLAISLMDHSGGVARKPELKPSQAPPVSPGFSTFAPPALEEEIFAPQPEDPPHAAAEPAADDHRKVLFFAQSGAGTEPTALSHSRKYLSRAYAPPVASSTGEDAPPEVGAAPMPVQGLPSNLVAVGDGVYQVTSAAPAADLAPPLATETPEPSTGGQVGAAPMQIEAAADGVDAGSVQERAEPCGTDELADSDASPAPAVTESPADQPKPVDQQAQATGSEPVRNRTEPQGGTASEAVQDSSPQTPTIDQGPRPSLAAAAGVAEPPVSASNTIRAGPAGAPPAVQVEDPPHCKVSVQVEGRGLGEMPFYLLHDGEPAIRLSSLLDLLRPEFPPRDFQRMHDSASAQAVVGISALAAGGLVFEVTDRTVTIAVAG